MKVNKTFLIIYTIFIIATLELVALLKNIDGQLFSVVIGSITALIGYSYGIVKKEK